MYFCVRLDLILLTSYCLQLAYSDWDFQNGRPALQLPAAHNLASNYPLPFSITNGAYIPSTPVSSWRFNVKSGVPTWIITTTEIETRTESVKPVDKDGEDPDSPLGPNLKEEGVMESSGIDGEDGEDFDVEFPARHEKEPAVRARPAFADLDKYEEMRMPSISANNSLQVNQTKTVTMNRTTVMKIEFLNTSVLPVVLRVDPSQRTSQGGNGSSSSGNKTSDSQQQAQEDKYSSNFDSSYSAKESSPRKTAYMGPNQSHSRRFPVEDTGSQIHPADQSPPQSWSTDDLRSVSNSPVTYTITRPLPPVPLAHKQLYYPEFVNYWKKR
ncbi:uncharacterized protein LOC111245125 isoform X1 [Varroa destructor]|uniref:Uncharacterized protein n=1 Tax=Varroa destructor TaxID=109461 RepID=A0A7M7JN82_VARDE|nr:uncharacterized protein LOC111245125 isoform X1 [Varroa destructor]